MSTVYYIYRVWCSTDNKYEQWILASTDPVPTGCPTNTSHTINSSLTTVVKEINQSIIKIEEESIPTGGNFSCKNISITALGNTTTNEYTTWPFPISALSISYVTKDIHENDIISMSVGKDTVTGVLLTDAVPSTAWTSQNYTVGSRVNFTHPTRGSGEYSCIKNTVSSENPSNSTYWQHGYEISVSPTVIKYIYAGYFGNLFNGAVSNDLNRVIFVDKQNNKLYMENSPTNTFSATSPTYFRQTVYVVQRCELGPAWEYVIGESKIGGSYTPAHTKIGLHYENKTENNKKFIINVEYLY